MDHCQLCLTPYTKDLIQLSMVNTSKKNGIFQCNKCFYIDDPIIIFNCDEPCPVCLEHSHFKCVYDICHHWICAKCHPNTTECCICKQKSEIKLFKYSIHNYFDLLGPDIKNCFKQLYIKINDTIGQELHVEANKTILYDLCVEYHKWLQLLHINDNNNNPEKLQPPKYIDQIWKEHMLDIPSYSTVCNAICGSVLYYYAEKNNLNKTVKLYEDTFGPITSPIMWAFKEEISATKISAIKIFVMTEKELGLPADVLSTTTVYKIKEMIKDVTNCNPTDINLVWNGKQLIDDRTMKDYDIQNNSIFHLFDKPVECDGSSIQICVKTLTGKTIMIKISPDETIYQLKKMIQPESGVPPNMMILRWDRKDLSNDHTIKYYKIQTGSTVYHLENLRGD